MRAPPLEELQVLVASRSQDYRLMGQLVALATMARNGEAAEVERLRAENVQLKLEIEAAKSIGSELARCHEALKPVLDTNPNSCMRGIDWANMCIKAVREAKSIYNEGRTE